MNNKIEVIIVDDHPMVIEGLKALLSNYDVLTVSHTFTKGKEAYEYLSVNSCDVVLMDVNLPDINGIELCDKLSSVNADLRILGMSTYNEASIIRQMIQNGAKGYLLKNASAKELYNAIENVCDGKTYFSLDVQSILAESSLKNVPHLTRREKEVLGLISSGETTQQIADKLYLSPLTVETHRRNLMQKFGVNNAPALIKMAIDHRLL